MIVQGLLTSLILTVLLVVSSIYYTRQAETGKAPKIRDIPSLEAMNEVLFRCEETGKSVHMNPGEGGLTGVYGPQTIAGLTIISYAMRKCAKLGIKMIVSIVNAEPIPLALAMLRDAYLEAGNPEEFSEDSVIYLPGRSLQLACWGLHKRENVGALIGVGVYRGQNYGLFESAKLIGAMSIGGTARMMHVPTIAVQADYFMLGEELFAAQAYIDREPIHLGCLAAEDIIKIVCIVIILLGTIFSGLEIDLIEKILLV